MSENYGSVTLWVSHIAFCFLHTVSCFQLRQIQCKQTLIVHFTIVTKDDLLEVSIIIYPFVPAHAVWCKVDIHQWISSMNIDLLCPSIHFVVSKKWGVFYEFEGIKPLLEPVLTYHH